jgi:hypothetical protein
MESFTAFVTAIATKKPSLPLRVERYAVPVPPPLVNSRAAQANALRKRMRDDTMPIPEDVPSAGEAVPPAAASPEPVLAVSSSTAVSSDQVPTTAQAASAPTRVSPVNPYSPRELLSRSTTKGVYESRFADVPLETLGCVPFDAENRFGKPRAAIGQMCCYLKLGYALIVHGMIVEVHENHAQVTPEKGLLVPVEWIPLERLYQVPPNLAEVRKKLLEKVDVLIPA